jgi:hypothetical protein
VAAADCYRAAPRKFPTSSTYKLRKTQLDIGLKANTGDVAAILCLALHPLFVIAAVETTRMVQERSVGVSEREMASTALPPFGVAVIGLQQELIQTYERLSRIWLERLQVEVALWTRLVGDLASSKSAADILKAYSDRMTKQFRMSAEDSRHIFSDYQEIARKFSGVDVERTHDGDGPEPEADLASEPRVTH